MTALSHERTRNARFGGSRRRAVVIGAALLLAACPETNSNPATVRPNASLDVFASHHNLKVLVSANPELTSPPPAEPVGYHPDDLTIRVTGAQLNRGLGSADLLVQAEEPFVCSRLQPGGGVEYTPASGPREVHATKTNPPDGPTGVIMFTYDLRDYLRQVGCTYPDARFRGHVRLILKVTNVGGLTTETPPLRLYPCSACA